jgi:hypothetical protein
MNLSAHPLVVDMLHRLVASEVRTKRTVVVSP